MRIGEHVLVLDLGSQYTQLIARRVRELGVYSEIRPYFSPVEEIAKDPPTALILSGGPSSVWDEGAPIIDPSIFSLGVPVLGICYGMQLTAHLLGGRVERSGHREFGPAELEILDESGLFENIPSATRVWMSHGDKILELPDGFKTIAKSGNSPVAAMRHSEKPIFGTQFHPEVVHTKLGKEILSNFLFGIAGCKPTWTPGSFAAEAVEEIRQRVGGKSVICALSGGVDSAVAARIVQSAVHEKLHCVFVDTGLMRKNEATGVISAFEAMDFNLIHVDAGRRFLDKLRGGKRP